MQASAAPPSSQEAEFFESKIRPVLVKHCFECHSEDAGLVQGGLRLDDPDSMLRGGDSGAAVMPGKPDKSLLLTAIRYDGLEMPPEGPLDDRVIKDFETWIKLGAADPREAGPTNPLPQDRDIDWDAARSFWSFKRPRLHDAPVRDRWVKSKIDAFVLAKLHSLGMNPNPQSNRHQWVRRVAIDLTGLPPSIELVEAFLADDRSGADQRLVERLLADPAHAEKWARLWLDVARYAEDQAHIVGNNTSLTYPNAYRYREWVVEALAADMPYDEFVRLQLAADLIAPDDLESHVALGFLGLGPKYYRRSSPEVMADEWEDRVDTVTRGLLGLTVACARCHDHKYDPIPISDYYALAGVFAGTEMFNRPLNDSVESKNGQAKKPEEAVHILREGEPRDLNVLIRGDVNNKGPVVGRHFLTVLHDQPVPLKNGSGRADLAEAITDSFNPLTARVIVNRVWYQFFGRPLVGTPSNFGTLGDTPSHPHLLDDLSVRFMQNGWSLKWLQREIVLSATYRQSSEVDAEKLSVDPENRFLWRVSRRRMSIEAYRDVVLTASGSLDRSVGGKSIQPDLPESNRRTLYSKISRLDLNPLLARFDFPDPNAHSAIRHQTTTPLQKLFLLNSPFIVKQADSLAKRIQEHGGSLRSRIEFAYQTTFARAPSDEELQITEAFVVDGTDEQWQQFAQTLLISNEMFMVD